MRTKTLLLSAALLAAGVAASMAQPTVYSINAVGYVNLAIPGGLSMIANPLNASPNNDLSLLNVEAGANFYLWNFDIQDFIIYTSIGGATWLPDNGPANSFAPGGGGFIQLSGPTTNTFVGEVMQGSLANPIPSVGA